MSTAWLDGPRQGVPWRGFRYPAGLVDEDHHDTIHQLVPFELWQRAQHLHWFRRANASPSGRGPRTPAKGFGIFYVRALGGKFSN